MENGQSNVSWDLAMENGQSNVSRDLAMGNSQNSVSGHKADCSECDKDNSLT